MRETSAHGPGTITEDGSAVEVYARVPAGGDPDLLHAHLLPAASVVDLGAGTGRLADPLTTLGHRVVAVDSSPDMLARITRASTVTSRIEDLRLPERFDAVLLPSHLINVPDADHRHRLLAAIARHLHPDGQAFIEWHPPTWFDALQPGLTLTGAIGELHSTLTVHTLQGGRLTATVTYQLRDDQDPRQRWTYSFTAQRLGLAQLQAEAQHAGLTITGALPDATQWLTATPTLPSP